VPFLSRGHVIGNSHLNFLLSVLKYQVLVEHYRCTILERWFNPYKAIQSFSFLLILFSGG
ncbi:hypothetical protein, partial [Prevotellamassilia timonensis]|uniref:hypothetical protein n=1 Tax=Prevotellamassilia timonensis TaxID=1852370 RepID=UPI003080C228